MNLYDTLGVSRDATHDEIKRSYRRLMKTHHPDRGGSGDRCTQINTAYEILSDSEKRRRYDKMNPEQKSRMSSVLMQLLELFVCRNGEFGSLVDFFFNNEIPEVSPFKKSDNKTIKKETEVRRVILDLDEAYGKRFFRFHHNGEDLIVPVSQGEYLYQTDKLSLSVSVEFVYSDDCEVKGSDIVLHREIDLFTYLYGGEFKVSLTDKQIQTLSLESFVHRDTVQLIPQKGLFYQTEDGETKRGDLYINFRLKDVDTQDTEKFKQLRSKIRSLIRQPV